MRVLITGIAGSGKSTIISLLKEKGYVAVDLDDCGVCAWVNKETGEQTDYREGAGKDWIENHRWQVILPNLTQLLQSYPADQHVFIGGKVTKSQAPDMQKLFDRIYLLQPDDMYVDKRLASRSSNAVNFGKKREERETILKNRHAFEKAFLTIGAIPLPNHGSVAEVVEKIVND